MNYWLWSTVALMFALLPCLYVCAFKPLPDRLVALEFASCIITLQMVCLAEGFHRPSFYDLPLTLALKMRPVPVEDSRYGRALSIDAILKEK